MVSLQVAAGSRDGVPPFHGGNTGSNPVGDVDCTLCLRHENQGQVSVIESEAGGAARLTLGTFASYSSGDR
jgi:hypothetical protein